MRKQQCVYQNKSSTSHLKKVTRVLLDPKTEEKKIIKKKRLWTIEYNKQAKMPEHDNNNTHVLSEEEDEVLAEYPIYLSTELTKYLYMFQYPMRSTPFSSKTGPSAARLKPKAKMVELDIPLDTRSTNYSTERGEDFAMGLNDKTIKTAYDRRMEEHEEELSMGNSYKAPKKEEELLDKMTMTSIDVPSQTQYVVGVIRDGKMNNLYI
jgi:hypothetical protein